MIAGTTKGRSLITSVSNVKGTNIMNVLAEQIPRWMTVVNEEVAPEIGTGMNQMRELNQGQDPLLNGEIDPHQRRGCVKDAIDRMIGMIDIQINQKIERGKNHPKSQILMIKRLGISRDQNQKHPPEDEKKQSQIRIEYAIGAGQEVYRGMRINQRKNAGIVQDQPVEKGIKRNRTISAVINPHLPIANAIARLQEKEPETNRKIAGMIRNAILRLKPGRDSVVQLLFKNPVRLRENHAKDMEPIENHGVVLR